MTMTRSEDQELRSWSEIYRIIGVTTTRPFDPGRRPALMLRRTPGHFSNAASFPLRPGGKISNILATQAVFRGQTTPVWLFSMSSPS